MSNTSFSTVRTCTCTAGPDTRCGKDARRPFRRNCTNLQRCTQPRIGTYSDCLSVFIRAGFFFDNWYIFYFCFYLKTQIENV